MDDPSHVSMPPKSASEERDKSKKIGALRALWPFMLPYWTLMVAAIAALVGTAIISLTLPLAVRRVVDNFGTEDAAILDLYFLAAIGIAGRARPWYGAALCVGHTTRGTRGRRHTKSSVQPSYRDVAQFL